MKYLIIGGVAGGATTAARLRRNDEQAEIVMVERGPYISFANCGLPYHLSGEIKSREQLLVTSAEAFGKRYALRILTQTEAIFIDRQARQVRLKNLRDHSETVESYDKLLLAPGAEPIRPNIPGIASPRVFSLRNIPDLDRIMASLNSAATRRAVVIGAGFIGVEVAESLRQRGLQVALLEGASQVLAPFDPEMAAMLQATLEDNQIDLHLADSVVEIENSKDCAVIHLHSGKRIDADLILLAIGVRPETALAREAGLETGCTGGIKVDERLQTSDANIFAVGDAIEVSHFVTGHPCLIPLAGPANRQARHAADTMSGAHCRTYPGTQGTAIIKVFDHAAASTGLNEKQLRASGTEYLTTITHSSSHASYYPGAMPVCIKLLYKPDGEILGAQVVGKDGVDKRIDVIATVLRNQGKVRDLAKLELAYAPPFGSAKDPVNTAGYVASNVLEGAFAPITWDRIAGLPLDTVQLLDVRTAAEIHNGAIPGAMHIELDTLRTRLGELDPARPVVVYCQVGLRGYLASRILSQNGYHDVRNLTGGYATWLAAQRYA
jgi:tRNA 2-thiouridine synthesizing protein A